MLITSQRIFFRARQREDNVAGLETDVMRFMAIFAFCLMAIFALVQSTEFNKPEDQTEKTLIDKSLVLADQVHEQQKVIQQQLEKLKDSKIAIEKLQLTNEKLANQLSHIKNNKLNSIEKRHKTETLVSKNKPVQSKKSTSTKAKFTLSFNSDNDLMKLLKSNTVKLYATKNNISLQAIIDRRKLKYVRANLSGRYYPMSTETVPDSLLKKLPDNFNHVQWHVALPDSMISKIQSLITKNSSGEIIINENAEVVLLPYNSS